MKNPFALIREIELSNLENSQKNFRTNISNIENFILWIVGFTITGIGLIVTNLEKLRQENLYENIQLILILLLLALFFGIFNRYSIHFLLIFSQKIDNYIKISLSSFDFPEINKDKLEKNISIDKLIEKFKFDYDLDYSESIDHYMQSNEKEKIIEDLKLKYIEIGLFLNANFNEGLDNVRNIYKEAYGYTEMQSKKIFYMDQSLVSKKFKIWRRLVDTSFIICCICFLTALIIMVLGIF